MNRLRLLRAKSNLTLRDLEKYVGIRNATLSAIENGKQPFREIHVLKLTGFFDVTSDYLLGYGNSGIGIFFNGSDDDEDHVFLSEADVARLNERYEIKETPIRRNASKWEISSPVETTTIYNGEWQIYREVNVSKENAGVSSSVREQVIQELNHLDTRALEKVLRFINDYIK